jgi:hypothetical protein
MKRKLSIYILMFLFFGFGLYIFIPNLVSNIPLAFLPDLPGDLQPNIYFKYNINSFPSASAKKAYIYKDFFYQVNSLGFRGQEVNLKRELKKIILLGDGFAFGTGLNIGESISEKLDTKLTNFYGKDKFVVLNAALPGSTISDNLSYMYEKGYRLRPETIILFVSPGDVWEMLRPGLYRDRCREFARSKLLAIKWLLTSRDYVLNDQTVWDNYFVKKLALPKNELKKLALKLYWDSFLKLKQLAEKWEGSIVVVIVNSDSLEGELKILFDEEKIPFLMVDSILKPEFDWNATVAGRGEINMLPWKLEDGHFGPKSADRISKILFELIVNKKINTNLANK